MKKTMTLLLLAALLVSQAAACGQTTPVTTDTTDEVTTAEPVDPLMPTDVKDWGTKAFTVLYPAVRLYIGAEEETGNGINDAIYRRDLAVEEKLNVDVQYLLVDTINDVYP